MNSTERTAFEAMYRKEPDTVSTILSQHADSQVLLCAERLRKAVNRDDVRHHSRFTTEDALYVIFQMVERGCVK